MVIYGELSTYVGISVNSRREKTLSAGKERTITETGRGLLISQTRSVCVIVKSTVF